MNTKLLKAAAIGSCLVGGATWLMASKSGKAYTESVKESVTDLMDQGQKVSSQSQKATAQLEHLKTLSAELLPEFEKGITKSLQKFEFQSTPRIEAIKTQIETIENKI